MAARLHEEVDAARARDALGPREMPLKTWRCMQVGKDGHGGRLYTSTSLLAYHAPPAAPIRVTLADIARIDVEGGNVVISSRDEQLVLSGVDSASEAVAELEELRVRAVEALMHRLTIGCGPAPQAPSTSSVSIHAPVPSSALATNSSFTPPVASLYSPLFSLPLTAAASARRLSCEVRAPLLVCQVLHALPARSVLRGASVDGTLHVTSSLLAFISSTARASLTIPLTAIALPLSIDGAGESLCFSVAARSVELWVGADRLESLANEVDRLARLAQLASPTPSHRRLSGHSGAAPPGIACVRSVARDEQTEAVKREAWRTYFAKHGPPESAVLRTAELPALVRAFSIPDELRPALWWHLSGGSLLVATRCVEFDPQLPCAKRAADEIERDLRRTLPDHPFFQKEEGLSALRRVLTAYAARNPTLGYCQSMNFVAALLLLFLTEDRAFAVLSLICERFLPGYYSPDMGGSLLDQRVFEEFVAERLPRLHTHLTTCGLPIPLLTLSWFLCLYSQILPLDASLHLLDIFLTEGSATVLFELGLAMLALNESALLHLPDPELVTEQLRRTDLYALFARVLDPAHALATAVLQERRARHRRMLVRHLRDENRARDRRRLKRENNNNGTTAAAALAASGGNNESPLGSPVLSPATQQVVMGVEPRYSPGLLDTIASVRSSLAPGGSPPTRSPALPLLLRDASDIAGASTAVAKLPSALEAPTPPLVPLMLGGERMQALQRYVDLGLLSVVQREPKLLERESSNVPRVRSSSSPIRVPSAVLVAAPDSNEGAADSPVARVQTEEIFSISL